jgi:acetyl esterase
MPLDPQLKAIMDAAAQLNMPELSTLSPEQARAQFAMGRPQGPGEEMASVEDRRIDGPLGPIDIRIYRPVAAGTLPALVYFHGGGFVIGSIETVDMLCRSLAKQAGCAVVSVEYRMAPEHKYPAAADDAYAATAWVAAHAEEIGIDAGSIAVGGDSAGGNLAAVVALMARDRGGPSIAFQLLVYPVTDHRFDTKSYIDNAEGYWLTTELMRWFWTHYLSTAAEGDEPYASPLRAPSVAGLPPALVLTAEFDPLRDEGEAYAARLREAGVPVALSRYHGMIHGFFGMSAIVDRARDAVAEASRALRSAFGST